MHTIKFITAFIPVADYINDYRDADRFMGYCRQCRNYGACWVCPPLPFDPLERISAYKHINLIGAKIFPGADIKTEEDTRRMLADARIGIDEKLLEIEKASAHRMAFFAGTCFDCPLEECTRKSGKPCPRPERLRYSLEAFGFDLEKTSRELLGTEMKWAAGGSLPEYYILISAIAGNDPEIHVRLE